MIGPRYQMYLTQFPHMQPGHNDARWIVVDESVKPFGQVVASGSIGAMRAAVRLLSLKSED